MIIVKIMIVMTIMVIIIMSLDWFAGDIVQIHDSDTDLGEWSVDTVQICDLVYMWQERISSIVI